MYSNSTVSSRYVRDTTSPNPSPSRDPYNYTLNDELSQQSMINKLPGKKDIQLSKYPQVVILFQAAQIQRLNNIISSHRMQNKGQNKQNLDRHSYQIQIKQLTLVIDQLKQQKKGLQKRIQDLNNAMNNVNRQKDNTSDIAILSNKYERALLEIGKMYDDNTKLQDQVNQLNWELAQIKAKQVSAFSNNTTNTYSLSLSPQSSHTHPTHPFQPNPKQTSTQPNITQPLPQLHPRTINQQSTRHLKQQISQLQARNSQNILQLRQQFAKQMQQYKQRMKQKSNIQAQQLQQQIVSANKRIQKYTVQITQANTQKWALQAKIRQMDIKIREYQSRIRNHQYDNVKFMDQINQLNGRITSLKNSAYFPEESLKLGKYKTVHDSVNIVNANNNNNINNSYNDNDHNDNQNTYSINITNPNQLSFANPSLSINSSYKQPSPSPSPSSLSLSAKSQQKLQNNIALLSQQLQRLTQLLKHKNKQLQQLQQKYTSSTTKYQKQLIQIRMKYQSDLRKQKQKYNQQQQRYDKQIQKYHRRVQQYQLSTIENNSKLQQQLINIKEEERKICQAVYDKKLKLLQIEYNRDRDQVNRLRRQLSALHEQIDILHQNQAQLKSQKRIQQLQYMQKIQQEQRKYDYKLRDIQLQLNKKQQLHDNNIIDIKQKYQQEISKLQNKLHKQTQQIQQLKQSKQKQVQYVQQIRILKQNNQNKICKMQNQRDARYANYQQLLRDKERQIAHMDDIVRSSNNQNNQTIRKQQEILMRKLDYLGEETTHAKNTIIQTMSLSKSNKLQEIQLSRIDNSLQYLSTQITTLSKQVMQSHLQHQQALQSAPTYYYSEQYVKQLQAQCDNYLTIINGKMCSNDSTLKQIWEQIENNNRYNREEQEKWRNALAKQQTLVEKYQEERDKWEQIRYQSQKIKYDCIKLEQNMQQAMRENEIKYQQEQQEIKNQMLLNHKKDVEKYTEEIQKLYYQVKNKENIIAQYSSKLQQFSKEQNEEIAHLTKIIQTKSKQFVELSSTITEYKNKYIQTKEKLRSFEDIIEKVIKDSQIDIKNMQKLEKENNTLKKQIDRLQKEVQVERDQKTKVVQRSRDQVRKITQQLTEEHITQQQFVYQQQDEQNNKIQSLQRQFNKLENIISHLRKDNYLLTRQNYDGSTQQYVNREFAYTKIRQLNKEIERLMSENIDLKDDLSRCRLELVSELNIDRRQQENLALMMLLFVEIEGLRKRLGNTRTS